MFESKYSRLLTVVLILIISTIVVLLAFLGWDFFKTSKIEKETGAYVEKINKEQEENEDKNDNKKEENNEVEQKPDENEWSDTSFGNIQTPDGSGGATGTVVMPQYKGYNVVGTMEIPAIKFSYPVLEKANNKALEISVGFLYGVGINQVGNSTISGHNYRNGLFFANNKKLNNGDKIYITDNTGKRVTYTIYNKFETTPEDVSFYSRDTNGKAEITLTTCTDDAKARLIILAKED